MSCSFFIEGVLAMNTNERENANSPKINAYILELSKDYNDYKKNVN